MNLLIESDHAGAIGSYLLRTPNVHSVVQIIEYMSKLYGMMIIQ